MLARFLKQPNFTSVNPYFADLLQPHDNHFYKIITGNHCYGLPYLVILQGPAYYLPEATLFVEQQLTSRMDEYAALFSNLSTKPQVKLALHDLKKQIDALHREFSTLPNCHLSLLITYQQRYLYAAGFTTHDIQMDLFNEKNDISKPLAPKYRQLLKAKQKSPDYFVFRTKVRPYDMIFTHTLVDNATKVIHEFVMPTEAEVLHARCELFNQRVHALENCITTQPLLIQQIVANIISSVMQRHMNEQHIPLLTRTLQVVFEVINSPHDKHITTLHELAKNIDETAKHIYLIKVGLLILGILILVTGAMAFLTFNITAGVAMVILGAMIAAASPMLELVNTYRFFGLSRELTQLANNTNSIHNDLPALDLSS